MRELIVLDERPPVDLSRRYRAALRAASALGVALLIVGCGHEIPARKPAPVAAQCEALCYRPCTTADIRWTANPLSAEAWDRLGDEVVQPLSQRVAECSRTHRRACHLCLWRLQEQGVLVGIPPLTDEEPEEDPP